MSTTAHHLKVKEFIFHDGAVFQVLKKESHGSAHVNFVLQEFTTYRQTTLKLSPKQVVRTVTPELFHCRMTGLEETDHGVRPVLMDDDERVRHKMTVANDDLLTKLSDHFDSDEPSPLKVTLQRVFVDKLHRVDHVVRADRFLHVEGVDMHHLHDHHHGKHHVHDHH